MFLLIEPVDDRPLELIRGSRLPSIVGQRYRAKPGFLFAKQTIDAESDSAPIPFWSEKVRVEDTRLKPDDTWAGEFEFRGQPKLRIRLIYRAFWEHPMRQKKMSNREVIVFDSR